MFESYVLYYLNRYLGTYLDGLDPKSLRCVPPAAAIQGHAPPPCRRAVTPPSSVRPRNVLTASPCTTAMLC